METAITAVVDGKLTNEALGGIQRRTNEIVRRVEDGAITFDWVMDELQRMVEGRENTSPNLPAFLLWKTLKLGTHKSAKELRKAMEQAGCNISDWAGGMLKQNAFTVAGQETDIDLVVVSVAELRFATGATRKDIYERAIQLGLALCPAEVGPQLRLQYLDQPMDEWLRIAMEPITDSDGGLSVFRVAHDGDGPWLRSDRGRPGSVWRAGNRWVFTRRKSK